MVKSIKQLDFEAAAAELAGSVLQCKENWLRMVSERVLPAAIFRAIERHGVKCSPFVRNWVRKHVLIAEHRGGLVEYRFKGRAVARAKFNIAFR